MAEPEAAVEPVIVAEGEVAALAPLPPAPPPLLPLRPSTCASETHMIWSSMIQKAPQSPSDTMAALTCWALCLL